MTDINELKNFFSFQRAHEAVLKITFSLSEIDKNELYKSNENARLQNSPYFCVFKYSSTAKRG